MLTLRKIGTHSDCLENIGMDFIESWYLKILIVEKILLREGCIQDPDQLELYNIHESEEDSEHLWVDGKIKKSLFRPAEKLGKQVSREIFDNVLDATFPLNTNDKRRFANIKKKTEKHVAKK